MSTNIDSKRVTGRLIGALSAAAAVCAVAAPMAAARTVTIQKTFTLRANATTTYTLVQDPNLSFADAGYLLSGPSLSVREDNLVDPYPHQPKNRGQISRDGVTIVDVGVSRFGEPSPFEVRVKTGKLSGTFKITLYLKQQS